MSSQAFLWVNLGLGLIVVLLFMVGRRGIAPPSRLNLRKGNYNPLENKNEKAVARTGKASVHYQSKSTDPLDASMKNLNVMFMYNGHNFDAYEVLGVPAGARIEMVEKAYQHAISQKGSDKEFLDAAFHAIKR